MITVPLPPRLFSQPLALLPAFALAPYQDARSTAPAQAGRVAIIPVVGCLMPAGWGWGQSYDSIAAAFTAAMNASDVDAVALLIDSPGGTVAGCYDLTDMIFEARGTKPIHAILAESAYSAAYCLASACDKIIVPRTGGCGSVGTLVIHTDISGMLTQIGVTMTPIQFGDRKTDGASFKPLSDDARARIQANIDYYGEMFVDTVARNRGMSPDAVRATQADVFYGPSAVEVGFADAVASADAALADLLSTL